MGKTYLSEGIEWAALTFHSIQAVVFGPEIAVGVVQGGSSFLRKFVQASSWLSLVRADVNQGAALYLLMFYVAVIYIVSLASVWTALALLQPRSPYVRVLFLLLLHSASLRPC